MNIDLTDKIVILTGGGGGIGRAIADRLADEKMKLLLLGGNNTGKLEATAEIVRKKSCCDIMPGNLTDPDFIVSSIQKITDKYGYADVLINNAGMAQNTPFENVTLEEFDKIMAINVRTPFMLTQKAIPLLKKSTAPTIINIASVVSHSGYPLQSIYSASKHALLGMTKSIAREYYKENIRVHAIAPGGVYTNMVKMCGAKPKYVSYLGEDNLKNLPLEQYCQD